MKKNWIFLILTFFSLIVKAQVLLLDKTDKNFLVNEKILSSQGKKCYTINCISKSDSLFQITGGVTPLVFLKVFSDSLRKQQLKEKPENSLELRSYVEKAAVPVLKRDMLMNIVNMSPLSNEIVVNVFDSVLIFDGKYYSLLEGVVEVSFYNLLDFDQLHIQQSSPTIINTKAKIASVFKSSKDGLTYVDYEKCQQQGIFPKLYLTKKEGDLYSFNLLSIDKNEDNELDYHREFVYKKGYGIIEFFGKWLFFHEMDGIKGAPRTLYSSNEYYDFK